MYFETLVSNDDLANQKPLAAIVILGLFSSDIFLPIPSSVVCAVAGKLFGVLIGTLLCWAGLNISAVMGYLLGRIFNWSAIRRFSSEQDVNDVEQLVKQWGIWPLVVFRPMPVLAEASILLMGMYRFPVRSFVLPVAIANFAVAATFVVIGNWFEKYDLFVVGLIVSIAIPVAMMLGWSIFRTRFIKSATSER